MGSTLPLRNRSMVSFLIRRRNMPARQKPGEIPSSHRRPRIYLAGPTVFMPDKVARGMALKGLCEDAGCEGLFPLDADLDGATDAQRIFDSCIAMLLKADCVVADLSPFRGPHVDDGTAFELGFTSARKLPIFGYSSDLRPLAHRIPGRMPGETVDHQGIDIEDFGEPFNAMIAGALAAPAFGSARDAVAAAAEALRR